jgi:hypothetical protein
MGLSGPSYRVKRSQLTERTGCIHQHAREATKGETAEMRAKGPRHVVLLRICLHN